MQQETVTFTASDLAKYPFLKAAAAYMQNPNLGFTKGISWNIADLVGTDEGQAILNRAEERLRQAIETVSVGKKLKSDLEVPSFPVAIMLAIATKNSFIKKRYALAEAKQAFSDMQSESLERLLAIATDFDWKLTRNKDSEIPLDYAMNFADYLRNVTHLRDEKWKLANRILTEGRVYLNQHDVARLLQEEVQRRIEKRLEITELPPFPPEINAIAERITGLAKEKIGESEMEGFPKVVSQSAFPPCIVALYEEASKGRHLSHIGRFTLTSFLVNVGMPPDKVAEVFKTFSDYNERLTRYQVEHIAGSRGSGTKYKPPKCGTLQTHGVCVRGDDLCRSVRHPLIYYKRKMNLRR
ncbi:MAG: hypothetical protein ACE14S_07170 [Candidatus Bathyarchaeia archaeon]